MINIFVFDKIPKLNVVSSPVMIDGYLKTGSRDFARQLFDRMLNHDIV